MMIAVGLMLVLSWITVWGAGKSWAETKHRGGWFHFLNQLNVIGGWTGFTWCWLLALTRLSILYFEGEDNEEYVEVLTGAFGRIADLGARVAGGVFIALAVVIALALWARSYQQRTFASEVTAGSTAAVEAVYQGFEVVDLFPSIDVDGDGDGCLFFILLLLFLVAVCLSFLMTFVILRHSVRSAAKVRHKRFVSPAWLEHRPGKPRGYV